MIDWEALGNFITLVGVPVFLSIMYSLLTVKFLNQMKSKDEIVAENQKRDDEKSDKMLDAFINAVGEIKEMRQAFEASNLKAEIRNTSNMETLIDNTTALEVHTQGISLMTDTIGNQNVAIQQILATLIRLEANVNLISAKFDTFKAGSERLSAEIEDTKQQLGDIKNDVVKLKKPKPPGVPVTPKPVNEINATKAEE